MIYGMYLSASGILANSLKQDVIANNLANSETTGFRRTLADVQERRTQAQEDGNAASTDPMLEGIGGGLMIKASSLDPSEGAFEETRQNLDLALHGKGYFAVQDGDTTRLTRNGHFILDRNGTLVMADGTHAPVLDVNQKPITVSGIAQSALTVSKDGSITAAGAQLTRLGVFDVEDESKLTPHGGTMLDAGKAGDLKASDASVQAGFLEGSNVDPMLEMTNLIEAQRQLETNANMLRMQDTSLGRLVNDVAKMS